MPRLTDPKWRELTLTEAHRNDIYALHTEYTFSQGASRFA